MEKNYEKAEKDYINGMTYKEIAKKYNVKENTVKSWKTRYGWIRGKKKDAQKKTHTKSGKVCTQKKIERQSSEEEDIDTDELSEKMQQFCVFFVKNKNATRAYMKAYGTDYASAAAGACRLLKKDKIKKYIKELKAQKAATMMFDPEDLVQRYMDIAYADVRDFVDVDERGYSLEVKGDFDGSLVSQIKTTKYGIEIKLPDRMKAMKWLDDYFEINPASKRKREYEKLKAQQLRMEIELAKQQEKQDEEEQEQYGAIMLAPVLEEETEELDECIVDTAAETD